MVGCPLRNPLKINGSEDYKTCFRCLPDTEMQKCVVTSNDTNKLTYESIFGIESNNTLKYV